MTSLVEPFYIINAHIQLMNDKYMVYVADELRLAVRKHYVIRKIYETPGGTNYSQN